MNSSWDSCLNYMFKGPYSKQSTFWISRWTFLLRDTIQLLQMQKKEFYFNMQYLTYLLDLLIKTPHKQLKLCFVFKRKIWNRNKNLHFYYIFTNISETCVYYCEYKSKIHVSDSSVWKCFLNDWGQKNRSKAN
jgi:hypothetical protein